MNRAMGQMCYVYCYPGTNYYIVIEHNSYKLVQLSEFGNDSWLIDDGIGRYK